MLRPRNIIGIVLLAVAAMLIWSTSALLGSSSPVGTFTVKITEQRPLTPAGPSTAMITLFSPDAPTDEKFPVLVYFADWDGTVVSNRRLLENLASNGFVVVAVTYPNAGPGMDFSSRTASEATIRNGNERVRQRAADASRALDWLGSSNLAAIAATSRAGVLGYSFGGAVSLEACATDKRFKAALNVDGWRFGKAFSEPAACPYMLIAGKEPAPAKPDVESYMAMFDWADYQREQADFSRPDVYWVVVDNFDHAAFSETTDWLHWAQSTLRNEGRFPNNVQILTAYSLAFFSKYLKGARTAILPGRSAEFPAVEVRSRPPLRR